MCYKAILENGGALISVPCRYKNQKMRKVVDNYLHALKFVPECFKTQKKKLDKVVNTYFSTIHFLTECFITQETCDKGFNKSFLHFGSIQNSRSIQ